MSNQAIAAAASKAHVEQSFSLRENLKKLCDSWA